MGMILPDRSNIDTAIYHTQRALTDAMRDGSLMPWQYNRWSSALVKAVASLNARGWRWNGSTLVMRSSDGFGQYRVTGSTCECVAFRRGQPCQHRMARRVITTALAIQASEFESRMETVLPRVTPGEAAAMAMDEAALDADMVAAQAAVDALV